MLNGYPLRLIVPGYFGTYWVKHVSDITVLDQTFAGFWMASAYRIPDNPTHSVAPGTVPRRNVQPGNSTAPKPNSSSNGKLSAGR